MKVGEKILLVHERGKAEGVVHEVDEGGVVLDALGYFHLRPVPGRPEIPVWEVREVSLAEALVRYMESMSQLREAANGYRAQLIADGWSETAAEGVAGTMLAMMVAKAVDP
jgi:hypothetical protein